MSLYTHFTGFMSGLFVLSGLFSLFLYVRRIDGKINLPYFFFATGVTAYLHLTTRLMYSDSLESIIRYDIMVTGVITASGIPLLYLVAGLTGYKPVRTLRILFAAFVLYFTVNLFLPYGVTYESVQGILIHRFFWGEEVRYIRGTTGIGNLGALVLMVGVLVYIIRATMHQMKHGERRYALQFLIVISLGILGMLVDTVLISLGIESVGFLANIGMLMFVLLIGHRNFLNLLHAGERIRESEEKVADREERLARLTEAAFEGIGISDRGIIVDANEQLATMFGSDAAALRGTPLDALLAPESRQQALVRMEQSDEHVSEHLAVRKDGSTFPIELRSKVSRYGERSMQFTAIRDITERKRVERELIAQKEHAERLDHLKDAFIANISHEIRTPINIMLGYADLISAAFASQSDERQREYFARLHRGASRLMRTVDEILTISRLQAGDFVVSPATIELGPLIQNLLDDYKTTAERKSIRLHFSDEYTGASTFADEYCVTQIFQNLVDNALKYTPSGSVMVRIHRGEQADIRVEVQDTGIGISEEYLPLMFEPYSQEESGYSRAYEGIGLGLALVKRYASLNNISIAVRSTKGEGTTIELTFPPAPFSTASTPREDAP